jgi:hypothetical protein
MPEEGASGRPSTIEHMVDQGGSLEINVSVEGPDGNDLKREGREVIKQQFRQRYGPIFERVRVNYQGRPVEEVKAALDQGLQAADVPLALSDAELSEQAEKLTAGEPASVRLRLPDGL